MLTPQSPISAILTPTPAADPTPLAAPTPLNAEAPTAAPAPAPLAEPTVENADAPIPDLGNTRPYTRGRSDTARCTDTIERRGTNRRAGTGTTRRADSRKC